jgi:DNA replication ATP-dependent helicase Dna2
MPSTQTRTKLKAFQFIEGAPSVESAKEREAEKENLRGVSGKMPKPIGTPKANRTATDTANPNKTPKLPTVVDCPPPSTPATTRLPLADLVGNIDDSSRHVAPPAASPEEQLIWRGSQAVNTPLPRKNKKRARSSSPVGPSQDEFRLDTNRQEITTPQADPVMELWSRYTNSKGTPNANKSVAFAHLINESSPRSVAAAGSVSGLRRWASCGVEFPASNRKKRRMHGVFQAERETVEDVFADAPSSDGAMLGQPTKPSIASMVQRMRECVSKSESRLSSQLPSSSSPLPRAGDHQDSSSGSPVQRRPREQDVGASETLQHESPSLGGDLDEDDETEQDEDRVNVEQTEPAPLQASPESSDDFGDDDFDADLVEALDVSPQQVVQSTHSTNHTNTSRQPATAPPQQQPQPATVAPSKVGSDDEFGMDDEDDFAADLEQVASFYDTRSPDPLTADSAPAADKGLSVATGNTAPATVISLIDDDDDEFGEDIDADEFAAAEVAATQAPGNTVCKTKTLF